MSYIKAVYLDLNGYSSDFIKGIELLEESAIKDAAVYFHRASQSVPVNHKYFAKYNSYYGFSRFLSGDASAISLCQKAVQLYPCDGDICMNLARIERLLNNRLKAIAIIDKGLKFSAEHVGLQLLKINLGVRKKNPLPLLPRNNFLSRVLGKQMRRY